MSNVKRGAIEMTKIEEMRKALSAEALAALAGQRGETIGMTVKLSPAMYPHLQTRILAELRVHGVIGPNDGLTIIGSGLVAKLRAELLDSLF